MPKTNGTYVIINAINFTSPLIQKYLVEVLKHLYITERHQPLRLVRMIVTENFIQLLNLNENKLELGLLSVKSPTHIAMVLTKPFQTATLAYLGDLDQTSHLGFKYPPTRG